MEEWTLKSLQLNWQWWFQLVLGGSQGDITQFASFWVCLYHFACYAGTTVIIEGNMKGIGINSPSVNSSLKNQWTFHLNWQYKCFEMWSITTNLWSVAPAMTNPRASRASTVRQASLPWPLFALDSKQNEIYFAEPKVLLMISTSKAQIHV